MVINLWFLQGVWGRVHGQNHQNCIQNRPNIDQPFLFISEPPESLSIHPYTSPIHKKSKTSSHPHLNPHKIPNKIFIFILFTQISSVCSQFLHLHMFLNFCINEYLLWGGCLTVKSLINERKIRHTHDVLTNSYKFR
jgi:hypothetical protein